MTTLNSKIAEVAFKVTASLEDEELQEILGQRGADISLSSIDVSRDQKVRLLKEMLYNSTHATQWGFRLSRVAEIPEEQETRRSSFFGYMDEATRRLNNYINKLNEDSCDNNQEILNVNLTSSNEFSLRGFPKYDEVFGKPIKGDTILNAHIRRVMHNFFKISDSTAVPQGVAKNLYLHLINQDLSLYCKSMGPLSNYWKHNLYYDLDLEIRDEFSFEHEDSFSKYWNKNMTNISWNISLREGTYSFELASQRGEESYGRFLLPRSQDGWKLMHRLSEIKQINDSHGTIYSIEPDRVDIVSSRNLEAELGDLI